MRVLITGFIAFVIWSFFSMWLYVDILKPATKRPVVISPAERPDMVADSLEKLRASMPEDLLIFFDFDKTEIKEDPSIDARVAELKTWLEKYPSAVLAITGHTDFIGTPEYNYKLGLERANAVRKYLEKKGIP
ncbi:MAG TPA: OmpA family protein [Bacteroidales bacterium]|nr:OmpA family protein [Bacteroidales bacterium]